MMPTHTGADGVAPSAARGAWRPLLRSRLAGRAEPLLIDTGGLRSAASIWSGAILWAQLLRSHPDVTSVVVWQAERLALLQLLVAALWDGRTLTVAPTSDVCVHGTLCLDGQRLLLDGQAAGQLAEGGWPDLPGPARLSTLQMMTVAPGDGDIRVPGQQAGQGELWQAFGAPLLAPVRAPDRAPVEAPRSEVLAPFDLAALVTPHDVLNDALLPLLRSTEVWEPAAHSAA